jgi:glycosyltransferase involved in cell wall biosynthesis
MKDALRRLMIVPTYNERDNIDRLLTDLRAADPELAILVVDDASPDGTAQLVRTRGRADPRISVLERPSKLGLGTAYLAGFEYAVGHGFDLALTMDADFSHPPSAVPGLVAAVRAGADLAIGSRYVPGGGISGWGLGRRLLSRFANTFVRLVLQLKPHDCTAGYRCYTRAVVVDLLRNPIRSSGYSALLELLFQVQRGGRQISEVPIHFRDRTAGESKISTKELFRALLTVLRLRLNPGRPVESGQSARPPAR